MKKIYLFLSLAIIAACNVDQGDEDFMNGRTPYAFFTNTSGTLFVEENVQSNFTVNLGLSDPQNRDLQYTIEVDPTSEAIEGVDFEIVTSNFSIQGGNLIAGFIVQGDFDTATIEGKVAKFNLVAVEDAVVSWKTQFNLTIVKFCPLEADFLGAYTLTQLTAGPAFAGGAPIFGNNITVTLTPGANPLQRIFSAKFYPAFGFANPSVPVVFELSCGNVNMIGNSQNSGIGCGGNNIEIGPSEDAPSTFNPADDNQFDITFTENTTLSCGDGTYQTVVRLVKQ